MHDHDSLTQLIGIYRLPTPIVFDGSCSGLTVDTFIGDYDARVTVPEIERHDHGSITTWSVNPPSIAMPRNLLDDMFEERSDPSTLQAPRWGTVHVHPTDQLPSFLVTDLLIEYEEFTYNHFAFERKADDGLELVADHSVMEFFADIDPWAARLTRWISVMVNQPLDESGRLKASFTEGERLVVVGRCSGEFSEPVHIAWSAPEIRDVEPVTRDTWWRAVHLASDHADPTPVEHLVADSELALALADHRLAVIQAATAVELVLSRLLTTHVAALQSPLASALVEERRTLGVLVRLLTPIFDLPSDLADLVAIRNRAVHGNYVPTADEASEVVRLGRQVMVIAAGLETPGEGDTA
jgi:hypothetical protein